jgi:hypothetical protein
VTSLQTTVYGVQRRGRERNLLLAPKNAAMTLANRPLRRALGAVAFAVALLVPAALAWAVTCPSKSSSCSSASSDDIVSQAYGGSIPEHHTQACYQQAYYSLDPDTRGYTDVPEVIQAAMRRDSRVDAACQQVSQSYNPDGTPRPDPTVADTGGAQGTTTDTSGSGIGGGSGGGTGGGTGGGPLKRFLQSAHSDPNSVPLPVIVLGILAALLVLGGLAGIVVRRRIEARPAGEQPPLL